MSTKSVFALAVLTFSWPGATGRRNNGGMTQSDPRNRPLPNGITRDVLERDELRKSLATAHPDVAMIRAMSSLGVDMHDHGQQPACGAV